MKNLNVNYLNSLSKKCRYDIVRMIQSANSGHIGGAMSSVDIYALLHSVMTDDDRLVVSHGHSSAALYSVLGNIGYFDIDDAVKKFRQIPPYSGHPAIDVNGVEWCSGALGQGLSVGCGFALAKKIKNEKGNVYVVMGDGEQQKGQLQEAREFAVKFNLDNLVAIVDYNGLQASGSVDTITKQSLEDKYKISGWDVKTVDGHCFEKMYDAIQTHDKPLCILAKTVMGKGIAEIENDYNYHGVVISKELSEKSLERLALSDDELKLVNEHKKSITKDKIKYPELKNLNRRTYEIGSSVDIRSAMGNALYDVAKDNPDTYMVALDCDLEGSVKLSDFKSVRSEGFIECGIAEHNAATITAAMAKSGIIAVHADFAMFNIAETYSQNRMADINESPYKLFCTHAGLDVGADGDTHQNIDYISILSNLYGFKVILPADANQADAAAKYALAEDSAVAIIGGRSKLSVLSDENGNALDFEYGKAQYLRKGTDCNIITYGNMVNRAITISDKLKEMGYSVGVINVSTPLALDEELICNAAKSGAIVTYEDHNVRSGIGSLIASLLCEKGISCKFVRKGVHKYGSSMSPDNLYAEQGLDVDTMIKEIINLIK